MKKTKAQRGLHLVTAEEASFIAQQDASTNVQPELAPGSQQELDTLIANGLRRFQQVQAELDRELFGDQNHEKLAALFPELRLLRERLAHYGIRV